MAATLYRFKVNAEVADGVSKAVDEADDSEVLLWRVPQNSALNESEAAALAQKISVESGYEVFSDAGALYFVVNTPSQCSTLLAMCTQRGLVQAAAHEDNEPTPPVDKGSTNTWIGLAAIIIVGIIIISALAGNHGSSKPSETAQQTNQTTTPEPQRQAQEAPSPATNSSEPSATSQSPADQPPDAAAQDTPPAQASPAPEPAVAPVTWRNGVEVLGSSSAPVKIELFFAPTCNHCVDFFRNTYPSLVREWVDTGRASIAFYNYPFGTADYAVEYVSRCIPENRYLKYYQKIFDYQAQWGYWRLGADTSAIKGALYSIAESEGLSEEQTDRCIEGAPRQGHWPVFTGGSRQNLSGVTALVINGEVFNDGNVINNMWTLRQIMRRKLAGQ